MTIQHATWAELTSAQAHDLIALRIDVFVVEQRCPYRELDGRDVDPRTEHVWSHDRSGPTAYLRVLTEPDTSLRIGRVCTRADARGRGLAAALLTDALSRAGGRRTGLEAQVPLTGWYRRFGFEVSGQEYLEDGIAHVPMRRPAD